ncbi:hypothetical protein V9T40_000505 [Parthenolecanium corni]|uniref:Cytochrome P450 n=1 Tax=Parthenolecanium corni TaxID=536013 RepID=A0AAN9TB60_9HEMI
MEYIVKYFDRYGSNFILYVESLIVIHTSSTEWVKWHQRRKMLAPAFSHSILNFACDVMRRNSEVLVMHLEAEVNSDGFDVVPYISSCSLDIIGEAAMSMKLNSQLGSSKKYLNNIQLITQKIADRISNGLLYPDIVHYFSKNYRDQNTCIKMLHGTSMRVIEQRIADRHSQKSDSREDLQNKTKKAFIDLLLDISEESPEALSIDDLLEEVTTFMFVGHDTTATSIAWTLFLVGHHLEVQKTIFDELDAIFGKSNRLPDQNDLAGMKYLECVVKESLRLYPPVSFISRCLVNDAKIGDFVIPAGVEICIHIHQLHRSREHFKNPNKFDPSHFFPHEVQNRNPFAYIPFSAGPRNCLGQKFAMLELKIILSQIFRNFEVESLQKMEDMKCMPDIVLRPELGVQMKMKKRICSN